MVGVEQHVDSPAATHLPNEGMRRITIYLQWRNQAGCWVRMAEYQHIEGDWEEERRRRSLSAWSWEGGRARPGAGERFLLAESERGRGGERMHLFYQEKWEVEGLQTVGILLVVCSSLKLMHFLGLIDLTTEGKTDGKRARRRSRIKTHCWRWWWCGGWGLGGGGLRTQLEFVCFCRVSCSEIEQFVCCASPD